MKLKRFAIIVSVVFLFSFFLHSTGESEKSLLPFSKDAITIKLAENIYAEILPRVELLSGVLSQTSWMYRRGPKGPGNKYFQELKMFFAKYYNHEAIRLAEDFTQKGFSYDAPPNFIINVNPLPDLEMINPYSEYLIKRARGKENLENFRKALIEISEKSNFISFFNFHRNDLEEVLKQTTKELNAEKIVSWLNNYFGFSGEEFHLVFAPAMFPGGGYAANRMEGDKNIIFQIVRESGHSNEQPFFQKNIKLAALTFHEFGHSYINPVVGMQKKLIDDFKLYDLYEPVKEKMKKIAYGTITTFFCETLVRSMTIVALEDYIGNTDFTNKLIQREESMGFYLTEFTYNKLIEYKKDRKKYKSFKEYLPILFKDLSIHKNVMLRKLD